MSDRLAQGEGDTVSRQACLLFYVSRMRGKKGEEKSRGAQWRQGCTVERTNSLEAN